MNAKLSTISKMTLIVKAEVLSTSYWTRSVTDPMWVAPLTT